MAASDKNIVITPNIGSASLSPSVVFTGDGNDPISIYALDGVPGSLSFEGSAGQLFSITNNLTSGSIFSVNDVSGIPSLDIDASGLVQIAPLGGTVAIGKSTVTPGNVLDVEGNVRIDGNITITQTSTITGLNADKLDNIDSTGFFIINSNTTSSGQITLTSTANPLTLNAIVFNNTESSGYYTGGTGTLAFDENFYADQSYGTGTYDPDTVFTGGNGGGLLIRNQDGWGAIFTTQNTRWASAEWDNLKIGSNQVWHAGNDGSGSGLDADLLDGIQGSSFLRSDANDSFSGTITNSGNFISSNSAISAAGFNKIRLGRSSSQYMSFWGDAGGNGMASISQTSNPKGNVRLAYSVDGGVTLENIYTFTGSSGTVWTTGNDGSGSGLDADTVDGVQASSFLRSDAADTSSGLITFSAGINVTNSTIGMGNDSAIIYFNDATNQTRSGYWTNKDGFEIRGDSNSKNNVVLQTGNLEINQNAYIVGDLGVGGDLNVIGSLSLTGGIATEAQTRADITTRVPSGFWQDGGSATTAEGWPQTTNTWYHLISSTHSNTSNYYSMQFAGSFYNSNDIYYRSTANSGTTAWNKIWHAGNDGSGSGLDADLLDGINSGSFLRSDANDTYTGTLTLNTNSSIRLSNQSGYGIETSDGRRVIDSIDNILRIGDVNKHTIVRLHGQGSDDFRVYYSGNDLQIWHAGNDGSGSGLDADTVDGIQGGSFLRSNADDTCSRRIRFSECDTDNHDTIATATGSLGAIEIFNNGSGNDAFMTFHTGGDYALYFGLDADSNSLAVGGWSMGANKYKIWHAGNDGSGSGLDADLLDGINSGSFLRSDANDTLSAVITGHASNTEVLRVRSSSYSGDYLYIGGWSSANSNDIGRIRMSSNLHIDSPANGNLYLNWYASNRIIHLGNTGQIVRAAGSNTVWHAGNDGSGSGLDADTVDGIQAGSFLRSDASDTTSGNLTVNGVIFCNEIRDRTGSQLVLSAGEASGKFSGQTGELVYLNAEGGILVSTPDSGHSNFQSGYVQESTRITGSYITVNGSTVWHAGNLSPLTTSTTFGGDVSGTYNAIVVANDSHSHAFNNLTGKTSGTGDYSTNADIVSGRGSGGVALTINDGKGNANVTFNHQNGVPEQNGNAARIEVNTDATSGATIYFEGKSNVTGGTNVNLNDWFTMSDSGATCLGNTVWHGGNDGSGSGLDADLLDGQQGSFYRNASNINAGTFPDRFSSTTRYNIGLIDGHNGSSYDKIRVYNSSSYTIGMASGQTHGWLNDWAMTFTMNNETDRGWKWRDTGDGVEAAAMSLTTNGNLCVSNVVAVGGQTTRYLREPAGDYGTVQATGAKGGWQGFSIAGQAVFMCDGANNFGLYDDTSNRWVIYHDDNDRTDFYDPDGNNVWMRMDNGAIYSYIATIMTDNDQLRLGSGSDFRMWHNGSHHYFRNYNHGNGNIYWQGEDNEGTNRALVYMITSGSRTYVSLYEDGGERLRTTSGGVTVYGNLNSTSDERYKKNIERIENALNKIEQLEGVTFDWNNDAFPEGDGQDGDAVSKPDFDKRSTGVIAQKVESVLPEAVTEDPETGMKNVAYGNMVGLLIEGIKELNSRLNVVEEKLEKLCQ